MGAFSSKNGPGLKICAGFARSLTASVNAWASISYKYKIKGDLELHDDYHSIYNA